MHKAIFDSARSAMRRFQQSEKRIFTRTRRVRFKPIRVPVRFADLMTGRLLRALSRADIAALRILIDQRSAGPLIDLDQLKAKIRLRREQK